MAGGSAAGKQHFCQVANGVTEAVAAQPAASGRARLVGTICSVKRLSFTALDDCPRQTASSLLFLRFPVCLWPWHSEPRAKNGSPDFRPSTDVTRLESAPALTLVAGILLSEPHAGPVRCWLMGSGMAQLEPACCSPHWTDGKTEAQSTLIYPR